jgi:hypothetical protein
MTAVISTIGTSEELREQIDGRQCRKRELRIECLGGLARIPACSVLIVRPFDRGISAFAVADAHRSRSPWPRFWSEVEFIAP